MVKGHSDYDYHNTIDRIDRLPDFQLISLCISKCTSKCTTPDQPSHAYTQYLQLYVNEYNKRRKNRRFQEAADL